MKEVINAFGASIFLHLYLVVLPAFLILEGYADVAAGIWAAAMVIAGIWLSAKGMAQLKRPDHLTDAQLETAYRYRNAGIALGLTGSGLLVFSWQSFLARFITAVTAAAAGM